MPRQKTVAIFTHGGFLAHVTRTYEVGRALAHHFGHRVVFCGEGPYMHIPRNAGYEVRPVYTVHRDTTLKLARRFGLCSLRWWRDECDRSVRSDVEVLNQINSDVVVGDMHWSLWAGARIKNVPYVSITNGAWTRWYAERIDAPQGHWSTKLMGKRLSQALFPHLMKALTWFYALGYTKIRKKYGLPPANSLFDLIEGDMTLLADLPEFMPVQAETPRSFRYVGPITWDADLPEPAWLRRLDPKRPTIYFTMGSTGDTKFFTEAIRVFGNTEYQVLITTGGLAKLENVPDNVFVEEYAPGQALMRASGVVVSHGGNGTVYQALSCGVPVIGFPTLFDQETNLQRVCALGAGLRMWRSEYRAEALKEAVNEVLGDPGYRARCQEIAGRIAHMDGPRRAALHIDHLIRSGSTVDQPDDVTAVVGRMSALEPSRLAGPA
jgi:MGT family glycosyltransferase